MVARGVLLCAARTERWTLVSNGASGGNFFVSASFWSLFTAINTEINVSYIVILKKWRNINLFGIPAEIMGF